MVLLADSDYIKAYTFLNGSIGEDYLRVAMYTAQEKWIRPYLGDSLYKAIQDRIVAGTVTGNYATLLNDYVKLPFAWFSVLEYLPNALVKIDNSGLVQRTSDDTAPASMSDLSLLTSQSRDNGEFLRQKMVDYLCANSNLFPEFTDNVWPEKSPIHKNFSQSGMTVSNGHGKKNRDGRFDFMYKP